MQTFVHAAIDRRALESQSASRDILNIQGADEAAETN
jgi:hypothetical protein